MKSACPPYVGSLLNIARRGMPMKTGHELTGLIKFLGRDDWKRHLDEVVAEHFGPAMEEFDLEYDEISEVLDDQWATTLWGCAFEDFLTRAVGAHGSNIVDVYLKRRGWNEGAQAKAYMKALRNSIMSLYEVSEIVPGRSLLARDLIRGGEPIPVSEATAMKTLKPFGHRKKLLEAIAELASAFPVSPQPQLNPRRTMLPSAAITYRNSLPNVASASPNRVDLTPGRASSKADRLIHIAQRDARARI
jgi:hypothetical protein